MMFADKDLDQRIILGMWDIEPTITIKYRNKVRLKLGTNWLIDKNTGNQDKVKGSVCVFNNKGQLTSMLP